MTYRRVLHSIVGLLMLAGGWIGSAQAALVIQRDGETYIAWEAEDFSTNVANNTNPWQVISDANASNGLTLTPNGGNNTAPGGGIATYQLQFDVGGTYRLYFRMRSPDGGSDSMFRAADFGVNPSEPPSPHLMITGGAYEWYNDSASPTRYLVEATDLGTTLTLSVGSRESGFRVDRIVLTTNTGLSDAELDALLNWDTYNHFTGTVDSDWSTAGNWEFGIAPRATTVAYIGDGKTAELAGSATVRQLLIGHADSTLPGNGVLNQTGGDLTVIERLAVGEMTSGSPGDTLTGSYTANAGTSLTVGDVATGRADLYLGNNSAAGVNGNSTNATGTLDLSAASTFNAHLNNLVVGQVTKAYARGNGTLKLAETNTIDATTFTISDLLHYQGRSVLNDKSEVVLGQTNTVKTNLLTVGGDRGQGTLKFADGASGGVLNLTGSSGQKANLRIAYTGADSSPQGNGMMDLSGGTFNATLGEVVVGYRYARGSGTGTLTFDDGVVTADSLVLGSASWAASNTGSGTIGGVLNMGGGSFTVAGDVVAGHGRNFVADGTYASRSSHGTGTINLSGTSVFSGASLALGVGEEHPSVVARGTGTLNISGSAAAEFGGSVTLGTGIAQSIGTINLTGGSLAVGGSVTGGAGTSTVNVDGGTMTVGGDLSVDTINFSGGTLAAQSIGGVGAGALNWTDGTLRMGTFGTAASPFNLVQDGGTLAPGNSPGMTSVFGDYTMNAGVLEIEINGLDQGDQGLVGNAGDGMGYDFVMVDGNATLAGSLNVLLLDGFLPELGTHFDVLQTSDALDIDGLTLGGNWPSVSFGWWEFDTVSLGDGFALRVSAVPEPGSALLVILACAGLLGCVRPRRRARRG